MSESPPLVGVAEVASVLADPSRAAMLLAMMDGRAWTLSELATVAGIAGPTATGHAHRLVESGLCAEVKQGRHRYLRLSGSDVAELLERLGDFGTARAKPVGLRAVTRDRALRAGRTCYRHLAGELGIAVCDGLLANQAVTPAWELTATGRKWFTDLSIDVERGSRQPLIRPCLDWTERREHLGGRLADALCLMMIERGWLKRQPDTRVVRVTPTGRTALEQHGIRVPAAASSATERTSSPHRMVGTGTT